jgi:hypothetical protein
VRWLATLPLLMLIGCSLLPDRFYAEVGESPFPTTAPGWEGEELVATVGASWSLKPQRVVVVGQEDRHPWDLGARFGVYEPEAPEPTPLIVEDANAQAIREAVDELRDEWHAVNQTLLGGGGLTTLILLAVGGRVLARRKQSTPKDSNHD